MPFWRAFFSPIWIFSFGTELKAHANELSLPVSFSPVTVGLVYLFLTLVANAPGQFWILSLFTFLPLIYLQGIAQQIVEATGKHDPELFRFNVWNWLGLIPGALLLALVVFSFTLPLE